jgi:hypothetical protein
LGAAAGVRLITTENHGQENLAITRFELAGGNVRVGGLARYAVDVCNQGTAARDAGTVELLANDAPVDRQVVQKIAPGQVVSVSLYAPMTQEGPLRLTARIGTDELGWDNVRYATAAVRRSLRVLCIDGNIPDQGRDRPTDFIMAALAPRGSEHPDPSLEVKAVTWMGLGSIRLSDYDLVILADVPDVGEDKAAELYEFVDHGGGLIVFMGDNVNPKVLNDRLRRGNQPLLPAVLQERLDKTQEHSDGVPLDPALPDHPLLAVLHSVPADLVANCRFTRIMRIAGATAEATVERPKTGIDIAAVGGAAANPGAGAEIPGARVLLKLAAGGEPILLERHLGRGKVLLFTSSADRSWNDMAVNPVFPLLLQQAMAYLPSGRSDRALLVNQPLILPIAADLANASVKVTDPAGSVHEVATTVRGGQVLVEMPETGQPGFYTVDTSAKAAAPAATGTPAAAAPPTPTEGGGVAIVAVNVDPAESDVKVLADAEWASVLSSTGVQFIGPGQNLTQTVARFRTGRELWYYLALAALLVLIAEGVIARRITHKAGIDRSRPTPAPQAQPGVAV